MRDLMVFTIPVLLSLWLLASSVTGQVEGDFWWLRETTEDSPSRGVSSLGDQESCECVKYYLCINGTINTSGGGIIDIRFEEPELASISNNRGGPQCPDLYDVCCLPPTPTTIIPAVSTNTLPTLHKDTPCECVTYNNCASDRIVSDGKGNVESLDTFGTYGSHSKCPQAFMVCCALEPTTYTPVVADTSHSHCDCVDANMCDSSGTIISSRMGFMGTRKLHSNPNPGIICKEKGKVCCNMPEKEVIRPTFDATAAFQTTTTTPLQSTENLLEAPYASCGTRNKQTITASLALMTSLFRCKF